MNYAKKYQIRELCAAKAKKDGVKVIEVYRQLSAKLDISITTFYKKAGANYVWWEEGDRFWVKSPQFSVLEERLAAVFLGVRWFRLLTRPFLKHRYGFRKMLKEALEVRRKREEAELNDVPT